MALLVWATIVAAAGCQSTPAPPEPSPPPAPTDSISDAQALFAQANQSSGARAATLYVKASAALIAEGLLQEANHTLDQADFSALETEGRAGYWFTRARLNETSGDNAGAREALQQAQALASRTIDNYAMGQMAARLCLALLSTDLDRYACAVEELARLAPTPEQLGPTNEQIWQLMDSSPPNQVGTHAANATGRAQGWWQLKADLQAGFSIAEQRIRLAHWQALWPTHPANDYLPRAVQNMASDNNRPRHVALLLPLSGPLARAGRAVRDGFVSAQLHAGERVSATLDALEGSRADPTPPFTVSVYDTTLTPIPALLERALTNGVDAIVGPLAKSRVEQLNELNPNIAVLTLNYLDAHATPSTNLRQLGLAIEDEADTIVGQLLLDNVQRVLVFNSYKEWSRRATDRLAEGWPYPLMVQSFADVKSITESVGTAMDVEASQRRRDVTGRALGLELEFLPRARRDVEAIVALLDPVEANALAPALRFHFAESLPVYASSQSVGGTKSGEMRALRGFRVLQLPWLLSNEALYVEMNSAFSLEGNSFSSLYALGVDAFRLTDRWGLLHGQNPRALMGGTGSLALDAHGRFHRRLAWGLVINTGLEPMPKER